MSRESVVTSLVVRIATIAATLQLLALALIASSELVPDKMIVEELISAVDSGEMTNTTVVEQRSGGIADHYGECVLLGIGIGPGEEEGWFTQIATSRTLHSCPSMINRLDTFLDDGTLLGVRKLRYWNGLSIISRPSLATIGINGLRALSMLSLFGSLIILHKNLRRSIDRLSAFVVVGSIAATSDLLGLVEVFHHPLMLSVGLLGVAFLARNSARDKEWDSLLIAGFIVGSLYSFMNLMNFVPGIWIMSSSVVAACVPTHREVRVRGKRTLAVVIGWPAGYLSMWVGKWFWAGIATSPRAVYEEITSQILYRFSGTNQFVTGEFGAGLRSNISFWYRQPLVPAVLIVSGLFIVVTLAKKQNRKDMDLGIAFTVLAPTVIILPCMLIANNHHEIHYWFEYRSFAMILGIIIMALRPIGRIQWLAYKR